MEVRRVGLEREKNFERLGIVKNDQLLKSAASNP